MERFLSFCFLLLVTVVVSSFLVHSAKTDEMIQRHGISEVVSAQNEQFSELNSYKDGASVRAWIKEDVGSDSISIKVKLLSEEEYHEVNQFDEVNSLEGGTFIDESAMFYVSGYVEGNKDVVVFTEVRE